jgi:hypothetical protein
MVSFACIAIVVFTGYFAMYIKLVCTSAHICTFGRREYAQIRFVQNTFGVPRV